MNITSQMLSFGIKNCIIKYVYLIFKMTIPLNGGVKVNVPEEYFEKALQRIEEMNRIEDVVTALEAETGSLDMCPKCGSKYLEPTRYSLWFLLPAILSWTPLFLRRKKWQCKSCGHKLK